MTNQVNDPIVRLFSLLFKDQSISIIHSCFLTLQETIKTTCKELLTVPMNEMNSKMESEVHQRIHQLYHDLTDLEYESSPELVTIVETESQDLFTSILHNMTIEGNYLILSYIHFSFFSIIQSLSSSYHMNLSRYLFLIIILSIALLQNSKLPSKHWLHSGFVII